MDGLSTQMDQTFASFEVSSISITTTMWMQTACMDLNCFIRVAVTDYAYLTDVVVIDPCSLLVRKLKLKSLVLSTVVGHCMRGLLLW